MIERELIDLINKLNIYRNAIRHIPKNGDRLSYETASGLEAVTGYLYLMESERLDEMFKLIFEEMGNE